MNERERIGSILAEKRKEAGLTLRELAEMCGINNANVSKIETGKYNVSIDILSKILSVLGYRLTVERRDGE